MTTSSFSSKPFNEPTPIEGHFYRNKIELPLIGIVKAGPPTLEEPLVNEFVSLDHYLISHPGHSYLLRVKDDSMVTEGINAGDLVILDKKREAKNGDIVAVQINNEWILTYYYRENNAIKFIAANSKYKNLESDDKEIIGGVVVSVIRKYY